MLRRGTILLLVCALLAWRSRQARPRRGAAGDAAAERPRRGAALGAARGEGDDRGGQPDPPPALRLGRRPPRLELARLRLLGLGQLRDARRRPARIAARLDRVHALGRRRRRQLGAHLRQPRTRLRRHRRPALGHLDDAKTATARGPGWSEYMRSGHGFRLRHPLGLCGLPGPSTPRPLGNEVRSARPAVQAASAILVPSTKASSSQLALGSFGSYKGSRPVTDRACRPGATPSEGRRER